jgi:sugar/nucleoside kinase (ribokinase family)
VPGEPPRGVFVGLTTLDVVYRVTALPKANEKVVALSQHLASGGPAANAAVTFAALGGSALLITALGSHVLARYAADEVTGRGVQILDAAPRIDSAPTVSSIYVVDSTGERSVVSVNAGAVQAPVPGGLESVVANADVVLLDGHHPELAVTAARLAREQAVPVVLDGGSWKPVLPELLPLVDVAICSADFTVPGVAEPAEAGAVAEALRRWGVEATAVTRGAGPVYWRWGDASGEVPVPQVAVCDTLGAGDVFHGAFAYAFAAMPDASPADMLRFAAQVAALRCTVPGPRAWLAMPTLADLVAPVAASIRSPGAGTKRRTIRETRA